MCVGEDEDIINPTVKIYNMAKFDRASGQPALVNSFRTSKTGGPQALVTALAAAEDAERVTHVAVGLVSGALIVFAGDLLHEREPRQLALRTDAGTGAATGGSGPITNAGFRRDERALYLFATTVAQVLTFELVSMTRRTIDETNGCEVGRAVMSDEQDLVAARTEAVYFYEADGRGPCFGFDGEKKALLWFRSYLVVVSGDNQTPKGITNTLTIYDLKNKFVAFADSFNCVSHVVHEWGSIFVFTADGRLYQLKEKDTQTKLETLFRKKLFMVAINLASSQALDAQSTVEIFIKYGNHLYDKGDYDGAIQQYIHTIGRMEPSYVIRKFLDAQRIHNLTSYLQALHEKNMANSDHTTLLLNCYTNLKDDKKLDQFLKDELNFDVKTAIRVLRRAGYKQQAIFLAEKHNVQSDYLKILLEDLKLYDRAITYISTLDFFEAERNIKEYGKHLIAYLPQQTTELIISLCTNYTPRREPGAAPAPAALMGTYVKIAMPAVLRSSADEFIHIFVHHPNWLARFLEAVVAHESVTPSELIFNTLLELYLRDDEPRPIPTSPAAAATAADAAPSAEDRRDKALALLKNPRARFDDAHALTLCQMHSFHAGIVFLYEKLKLYHEIVQFHMYQHGYNELIAAVIRYGEADVALWVQVLAYFASLEKCEAQLMRVLEHIDRDNLMPPLGVIQILSSYSAVPLSVIREYLSRRLLKEVQGAQEDARQIKVYRDEMEKMRAERDELRSGAKTFAASKCSACTGPFEGDLPTVHFFCNHSFHQRCLGDSERDIGECPICAPSNAKILDVKRALEDNSQQHEQFAKLLTAAGNEGFSVVAEYLGRDVFAPGRKPAPPPSIQILTAIKPPAAAAKAP